MRGDIFVPMAMVAALLWATALVAIAISEWKAFFSTLSGVLCLLIAVFCVYGFAASLEPGGGVEWRVGYATLTGLFLAAALFQSTRVFGKHG